MGRWLNRVAAENKAASMARVGASPVSGSTSPDLHDIRHTSMVGLAAAEADYDRIGAEIDALADQAKAARERGDAAEGERLGAQVRALVAGPYLQAGERYTALLAGVAPETVA